MKIERLSPSSYKSWDGCPHNYWIENNLGYRWQPHIKADMGTAVHLALEIMAMIKLEQQKDPNFARLSLPKRNMDFAADTPPSELLDYAIKRKPEGFFDEEQIDKMHEYLDTALGFSGGEYDPRNRKIIASEKRISIPIPRDWALISKGSEEEKEKRFKMTGIMDVVSEVDKDTLEVLDYKTANIKNFDTGRNKTYADHYEDIQLRMYHWAAAQMYPEYKNIIVSIFYFPSKNVFNIGFSQEDLEKTIDMLRDRYQEIAACDEPKRNIRYFFCNKLCGQGQNLASKTNLPAGDQPCGGGIAKAGQPMTVCDAAKQARDLYGIEYCEENFKRTKYK